MFGVRKSVGRGRAFTVAACCGALLIAVGGVSFAREASSSKTSPDAGTTSDAVTIPSSVGVQSGDCLNGITTSAPIVIATPADWTKVNAVSGDGSSGNPYVIECLSITGVAPSTNAALSISAAAATGVSYVVRNVLVEGGTTLPVGLSVPAPTGDASALLEHNTVNGFVTGISVTNGVGAIELDGNLTTGAGSFGIRVSVADLVMRDNYGTGATSKCEWLVATHSGSVTGDTCTDGGDVGFDIGGPQSGSGLPMFAMTGATAESNHGDGFFLSSVDAESNTADANGTGFHLTGTNIINHNTIVWNNGAGIDLTGNNSTISDNTIEHNASVGIAVDPSYNTSTFKFDSATTIIDNRIGDNPYGITFIGVAPGNEVSDTTWTDGQQTIVDFEDQNTVVDAGSDKRTAAGSAVQFSDYIARLTVGNVDPTPLTPPTVGGICCFGKSDPGLEVAGITGITWDFGDGSAPATVSDPTQGHGPPPIVGHTYDSKGNYTATLTVQGMGSKGDAITLSDTVLVTVGAVGPDRSKAHGRPGKGGGPSVPTDTSWSSFGYGPGRSFYNGNETAITKDSITQLIPKWRYPTSFPVTASPAIANVDTGSGTQKVAFDGDFAGTFFAVQTDTGLPLWTTCLAALSHLPAPGTPPAPASAPPPVCSPPVPFPTQVSPAGNPDNPTDYGVIVASPAVANITTSTGTEQRVFEGANATMFALDAATGAVRWQFVAGASDPTYDIESSPLVVGNQVIFGLDCNQHCDKGGGLYSVDADDGHLQWFFDPVSGTSFVPPDNSIHEYAPTDHPSDPGGTCGGIWSSPSIDLSLGLVFADTSNCAEQASPFYEAVFALHLGDGSPAWSFSPRALDGRDMDFGATPNAFVIDQSAPACPCRGRAAPGQHVVGAGGKDGVYYLMDAAKGTLIWSQKLTLGGSLGGFFNSATDGRTIYLISALGEPPPTFTAVDDTRRGREFAIDAATGNEVWVQTRGAPNFGQDSLIPGLYLTSGLDHFVHAWDATTGALVWSYPLGGASATSPVVSGGELFIGAGTGATYRSEFVQNGDPIGIGPPGFMPAPIPLTEPAQGLWAFCLSSDPACVAHAGTG